MESLLQERPLELLAERSQSLAKNNDVRNVAAWRP